MIDYKNFKVGDRFGETFGGRVENFTVSEETQIGSISFDGKTFKQYSWKAIRDDDKWECNFLITENHEHYGPKLVEVK